MKKYLLSLSLFFLFTQITFAENTPTTENYIAQTNPSLERCQKLVNIFLNEGNWTARFGDTSELKTCKSMFYKMDNNWELKEINSNDYSIQADPNLERCQKLVNIFRTQSWTPYFGSTEEIQTCKQKFYEPTTTNWILKKTTPENNPPQTKPNSTITPILKTPKAGYEAEVITIKKVQVSPFSDKHIETLEGKAATHLYETGIIGGYSDGTFKGNKLVNRAEAAKFLILAKFGEINTSSTNTRSQFWDIPENQWYVPFVNKAVENNIIKGHPDGSFRPKKGVRRGEFLALLTRAFDLQTNTYHNFEDVKDTWANEYAGVAWNYNIFPQNTSNHLGFGEFMTRDEVAVGIYQYLQYRDY